MHLLPSAVWRNKPCCASRAVSSVMEQAWLCTSYRQQCEGTSTAVPRVPSAVWRNKPCCASRAVSRVMEQAWLCTSYRQQCDGTSLAVHLLPSAVWWNKPGCAPLTASSVKEQALLLNMQIRSLGSFDSSHLHVDAKCSEYWDVNVVHEACIVLLTD